MSKYNETHLLRSHIGNDKWLLDERFPNMIKVELGTQDERWVEGSDDKGFNYFEWIKVVSNLYYLEELNPNLENE
jgi:hypothetical protein